MVKETRQEKERRMKKLTAVVSAVMVLMGGGITGAQDAQPVDKTTEVQTVKKQAVCPVMGGEVNTNLFVDHDGRRIYACCPGCVGELKKHPAKYITKLEKDGVTLDKTPAADLTKK
jgi:YHS domain-containing protein